MTKEVFARPQQKICCANPNSCVAWSACFAPGYNTKDVDGDGDPCYPVLNCYGNIDCSYYNDESSCPTGYGCTWVVDADSSPTACSDKVGSNRWDLGGEASSSGDLCCGDDAGEYKIVHMSWELDDGSSKITWKNMGDNVACCDASDDQVDYDGNCHKGYVWLDSDRKAVSTGFGADDKYAVPYWSGWIDCDYESTTVTRFCNTNGNICDGGWVQAGENVGEYGANQYPANNGYGCCGDDLGENYVTAGVGPSKCCSSSSDCVDNNGNCQSGNTETGALCSDGIDNDCDGDTDCADTGCIGSGICCGYENTECCTSGDDCTGSLYCDTTYAIDYCCQVGWYWNGVVCVDADPCGLGGTQASDGLCYVDISNNLLGWLADPDCYQAPSSGCCEVFRYGELEYYPEDITTY